MTDAGHDLADEVADAHGAATLAAARLLVVEFSSGGLAFATKGQRDALDHARARLCPTRQEISIEGDRPRSWEVAFSSSEELRERLLQLRKGARQFRWQPDDVGSFAAGALWTYLCMPLLLGHAEQLQRLPDFHRARRLHVKLPTAVAGHGPTQTLHIGPDGLIHRHDYTATAFGSWARAAQFIGGYRTFDGIPIGTRRRVVPRVLARRSAPTLVWIDVHAFHLSP